MGYKNYIPGTPHPGQPILFKLLKENCLQFMKPGYKVLDIGARTLDAAVFLKEYGINVISIDICPETVLSANKCGYTAFCASAESLPFQSKTMDFIIASHVLEHVPDLSRTIYELMRVLRLEGKIMVRVPLNSYYRHHRYMIEDASSMLESIRHQCECSTVICIEDDFGMHLEAFMILEKSRPPHYTPIRYKYDYFGTYRGLLWRLRNTCKSYIKRRETSY